MTFIDRTSFSSRCVAVVLGLSLLLSAFPASFFEFNFASAATDTYDVNVVANSAAGTEYVEVENNSGADLDMSNIEVREEGSGEFYSYTGTLLDGESLRICSDETLSPDCDAEWSGGDKLNNSGGDTVSFHLQSDGTELGSVTIPDPAVVDQVYSGTFSTTVTPATITITDVTELRDAIENQADGQTWIIEAGTYPLDRSSTIEANGQTGWYFPIVADDITIEGQGNPTIYGDEFSANGAHATQNLVSVFGDNVTIDGLTLMPKVEPNKTLEVLGEDFTLRNTTFSPNTLIDSSKYDSISDPTWAEEAKQWGGSLYFNHEGDHSVENVVINNGGISYRYAPADTHITLSDVTLEYETDVEWIHGYRYSSGFNEAGNTITGDIDVIYHLSESLGNLQFVLDAMQDEDLIELDSNLTTNEQLTLDHAVTFDGNGNTIDAAFTKTSNSNNSAVSVQSDDVTINNLVVDGTNGTDLHGINVYESTGVVIDSVTAISFRSGIGVNSSGVTARNITTSGNVWHGINVDKRTSMPASLTIEEVSMHDENSPTPPSAFVDGTHVAHIFVDDATEGTVVNDVDNQYDTAEVDFRGGRADVFTLKSEEVKPQITFITPEVNERIAGIYTVSGTATDDSGIAGDVIDVELRPLKDNGKCGGQAALFEDVAVDTNGDWSFNFDTDPHANGRYCFSAYASDTVGNSQTAHLKSFEIDDTIPAVTITAPEVDEEVSGTSIVVTGTATDDDGIKDDEVAVHIRPLKEDTGNCGAFELSATVPVVAGEWSHSFDASTLAEGRYCVTVLAEDTIGNTNGGGTHVKSFIFTLDDEAPVTTFFTPANNSGASTTRVTGEIVDNQNVAQYSFNISGPESWSTKKWTPNTASTTFDVNLCEEDRLNECDENTLPEGEYKVRVAAYDGNGNRDISTNVTFIFDQTAPTITVKDSSVPATGGYKEISFKLFDEYQVDKLTVNGVEKDLTNNKWSDLNFVEPGRFGATEGENTLVLYDVAGNTTSFVFTLVVDVDKPSVTIETPDHGERFYTDTITATGTATDTQSVIDEVLYTVTEIDDINGTYVASVDSGVANGTDMWNFVVDNLVAGFYRLKVQAFDEEGNWRYKYHDVEVAEACTLEVVSNEQTVIVESNTTATNTYVHPNWSADIDDAEWIWNSYYVNDPENDETLTFRETFSVATVTEAILEVAADNGYVLYINGELVEDRSGIGNNFSSHSQKEYDVASYLQVGENDMEIVVTNNGTEGENAMSNPAGVLYKLTVEAAMVENSCVVTTKPEPEVATLQITDPDSDGDTLDDAPYTFEAEYYDNDEETDTIAWAIYAGTCTFTGDNRMAGSDDDDPSTFAAPLFSATVDMSDWDTGQYCFVVNPQEGEDEEDLRATRTFNLATSTDTESEETEGDEELTEPEPETTIQSGSLGGGSAQRFGDTTGPIQRVLGASTTSVCPFVINHMQIGWDNDEWEVSKLQAFLSVIMGYDNPITGEFDATTDANVKRFQEAFKSEVLTPWFVAGIVPHDRPTGFVYKTTKWKINSMVCPDYEEYPSLEGETLNENVDID